MNLFRWQAVLGLAMVLAIAADVHGQRKVDPHISYVYPGGGKQGTTIEVVAGGQFLKEVDEVYVSGGGVRVTVGKYFKHLSEQEYRGLRMRASFYTRERLAEEAKKKGLQPKRYTLEELIKLTNYTDEQLEQMEDYRKRDDPKRQFNPQLLEDVTLKIQIDPDAALGDREIRLITPSGMSNPMFFQVSNLAEVRETEPNDKTPDPVVGDKLPAVINGQIMPGDVDRFAFKARKGTRLVAAASVRALVPYLADAVPGWFQAVLAIYDSNGNELAYADSLGFRQDPVIYYEIPKDGEYVVQIWDSIYRGREDFVYRIAMGELPFITSVFPLGGRAGTKLNVELTGWNLPVQQVPMNAFYDRRRPIRSISVRQGELVSNRIDFPVDMLTETVEKEPNNKQDTAQEVPIPVIMNGRIDKPGDIDVFKFEGHASEHFIAEVFARRLGSPMDSLVRLTDANGREVAFNDDYKDEGTPLITHHADSRLSATLPTSGTYHLHVIDAQRRGGPENGYRLYMRQPRPDFELRVVPSTIITRPGSCVPIIVYALRRDGFTGEIQLELEEAPPGFALTTSVLPANQDKVWLTLMVPPKAIKEPVTLDLGGRAVLRGGRKLSHLAVPAEDWMQAFAYHHLVPTKEWTVSVSGKGVFRPPVQARNDTIKLSPGGTARVVLYAVAKANVEDIRLELSEPPAGILIQKQSSDSSGITVILSAEKTVKPGIAGNLIFNAFREYIPLTSEGKPRPAQRNLICAVPAVPFEVGAQATRSEKKR